LKFLYFFWVIFLILKLYIFILPGFLIRHSHNRLHFYSLFKNHNKNKETVRQGNTLSYLFSIVADTFKRRDLAPDLCGLYIYTANIPRSPDILLGTFADDKTSYPHIMSLQQLHTVCDITQIYWTLTKTSLSKYSKSTHITFFPRRHMICPSIKINNNIIFHVSNETKYDRIIVDKHLNWSPYLNDMSQ